MSRSPLWVALMGLFLVLAACGPPATLVSRTPTAADAVPPPYLEATPYPPPPLPATRTPRPTREPSATPALGPPTQRASPIAPTWTPALDDPYGPADAVALLTIDVGQKEITSCR